MFYPKVWHWFDEPTVASTEVCDPLIIISFLCYYTHHIYRIHYCLNHFLFTLSEVVALWIPRRSSNENAKMGVVLIQELTVAHTRFLNRHDVKICSLDSSISSQQGHIMFDIGIPRFDNASRPRVGVLSRFALHVRVLTLEGTQLFHCIFLSDSCCSCSSSVLRM